MRKLIAFALICGAATSAWARPPIAVPPAVDASSAVVQSNPSHLQPTPALPGEQLHPLPSPPGTYVVPGEYPGMPGPAPALQPGMILCDATAGAMIPLYPKVKVIQERNIAPCAVPKIVTVPDPCDPCRCVCITICVPPCACEQIECSKHGRRTTFDYGKYQVKVTQRHGHLVVNYDD